MVVALVALTVAFVLAVIDRIRGRDRGHLLAVELGRPADALMELASAESARCGFKLSSPFRLSIVNPLARMYVNRDALALGSGPWFYLFERDGGEISWPNMANQFHVRSGSFEAEVFVTQGEQVQRMLRENGWLPASSHRGPER